MLDYSCDCPIGSDRAFCKHGVAAALAWLNRAAGAAKSPKRRKTKEVTLADAGTILRNRQEEVRRQPEEDAARAASERMRLIDYGVAAVVVVASTWCTAGGMPRAGRLKLPRELAEAGQALEAADRKKAEAQVALLDLRKQAPEEVCQRSDAALATAPDELGRQRSDLQDLRSLPRVSFAAFRAQREEAQRMVESLWHRLRGATALL